MYPLGDGERGVTSALLEAAKSPHPTGRPPPRGAKPGGGSSLFADVAGRGGARAARLSSSIRAAISGKSSSSATSLGRILSRFTAAQDALLHEPAFEPPHDQ